MLDIMTHFVAIIVCDLGDIFLIGVVVAFPLFYIFGLGDISPKSVGLKNIELGDISDILACDGASFFLSLLF